ncbi:glycosyltransferase family 64 protein C4-like [Selaginella moellendorffii]|uniref:glycosyltransferase family 64 protein C4-like n=1 Tax=Selaginella moellendorffii TaxID=88036 RepID=UPI000D1CC826|nr:glycosyltransferase family 64 protein C4-like [Selaginella moellendorffii]XP_024515340.1 glycosyltransferase family 64 protein C4-like [Selaginella moellendorffii]|eukprot:XP_024515339.1 glycosyltransferase family 64 protein C4-like [Selaginella moellendorffii]
MSSLVARDHKVLVKAGRPSSSSSRCWRSPLAWFYRISSWRSRLLLGISMLIFIFLVSAAIVRWNQDEANFLLVSRHHRYTVLVNTWKRYDLLRKSVAHYASCRGVDAIRVVWSESEPPSESLLAALEKSIRAAENNPELELRIDINDEDNLNNRFKPLDGVTTDGIFSIDDDVLVPCTTLEFSFRVWLSAPDSMVGFVPRMHWARLKNNWKQISPTFRPEQPTFTYGGWWSVWWMGTYSMVLTKAAFLHHKYLEYYTLQMPASIREYVANQRNCEDIAMSFMVANLTNAPPIWVKGKLYEIGSSGISSLKGHDVHRTVCVNFLAARYGYMPLVASNVKAVDANLQWFW